MRLFAHRGFVLESQQENTVASLNQAVEAQFKAIEFDLWFVAQRMVLKHDKPSDEEAPILPDLGDYLAYKNDLVYWLDFKNLNEENATKALMIVKREIEDAEVKLDQIYFAPFITDFVLAEKIYLRIRNIFGSRAKIIAVCENLKNENEARDLKSFLDRNNIKCLSIFHQLIGKNLLQILSGIEIFAWTVNEISRLKELEALGVANFATDKITPQIYDDTDKSRSSQKS